ncbi:MAG: 50S ribosomal protein L29 [Oscillospiraceae bacterium]|nr:50S ribosomal protein L29 [Oscillospiraceae bacterium]
MKIRDIRDMTSNELTGKLKELKEEMFNLRFQNATNQLENPMRIAVVRKDIAKVMTVLKEQELGLRVEG